MNLISKYIFAVFFILGMACFYHSVEARAQEEMTAVAKESEVEQTAFSRSYLANWTAVKILEALTFSDQRKFNQTPRHEKIFTEDGFEEYKKALRFVGIEDQSEAADITGAFIVTSPIEPPVTVSERYTDTGYKEVTFLLPLVMSMQKSGQVVNYNYIAEISVIPARRDVQDPYETPTDIQISHLNLAHFLPKHICEGDASLQSAFLINARQENAQLRSRIRALEARMENLKSNERPAP